MEPAEPGPSTTKLKETDMEDEVSESEPIEEPIEEDMCPECGGSMAGAGSLGLCVPCTACDLGV